MMMMIMIMEVIVILILSVLYYLIKSVKDKIQHHFNLSVFSMIKNDKIKEWFNPEKSWEKKYFKNFKGQFRPASDSLYNKIFGVKYKEKFLFSSTFLVFVTDAWHFCNFLQGLCILGMIYIVTDNIVSTLAIRIISGIVFVTFYSNILNLKR